MDYDIAANCVSCHGLAREDIKPDVLAKLLAAGHSVEPDFELVRYSSMPSASASGRASATANISGDRPVKRRKTATSSPVG
jgi:hypothetical protein